jgi:hypothetical protein
MNHSTKIAPLPKIRFHVDGFLFTSGDFHFVSSGSSRVHFLINILIRKLFASHQNPRLTKRNGKSKTHRQEAEALCLSTLMFMHKKVNRMKISRARM